MVMVAVSRLVTMGLAGLAGLAAGAAAREKMDSPYLDLYSRYRGTFSDLTA